MVKLLNHNKKYPHHIVTYFMLKVEGGGLRYSHRPQVKVFLRSYTTGTWRHLSPISGTNYSGCDIVPQNNAK